MQRLMTQPGTRQNKSRWNAIVADPRTAPSLGVERCTHAAWVRPVVAAAGIGRPKPAPHTGAYHLKQLQYLASRSVGWLQAPLGGEILGASSTLQYPGQTGCASCALTVLGGGWTVLWAGIWAAR
jgi:hypothetical protein